MNVNQEEIREFTDKNIHHFKTELSKVNWDDVCSINDVNDTYSKFLEKFNSLYDKCIPKIDVKARSRKTKPKSPWITFSLIKYI